MKWHVDGRNPVPAPFRGKAENRPVLRYHRTMTHAFARIPALICPAGSLPALKAAVDHGADAVYLGFKNDTNARNFAGLNFDAKLRRPSVDIEDLFYAHIGGMDAYALAFKIARKILADGKFEQVVADRYSSFDKGLAPISKTAKSVSRNSRSSSSPSLANPSPRAASRSTSKT